MRGQTTLDFVIGIVVFLAVLIFIFTFVPGILEPFAAVSEENPALSNRVADSLTQGMLGSPERPHVLDRYCTVQFFDDGPPPDQCRYDGGTLSERFNLGPTQNLNVSLLSTGGSVLCFESDDGGNLTEGSDCTGEDTRLTAGEDVPDNRATMTAQRVVHFHGAPVRLEVVVW